LTLLGVAGHRRRCPAITPVASRVTRDAPYPADPPTVEEIVAVMRQAGEDRHGLRARALIVVLWRAALRIQEALCLTETDLDSNCCSVLVQRGKGGHLREVGMDMWAWGALRPWLNERKQLPVGPLFCVIDGSTRGVRAWSSATVRAEFRQIAADAGVRRRFAPHQYADLWVMPTMPGELLHQLDLAVGKVGVIRGVHGALRMNGAREKRAASVDPFRRAQRAEHPRTAMRSGAFGTRARQPARAATRYDHTGFLATVKRNTQRRGVGLCRSHHPEIPATRGGSPTHRHNREVGILMLVPTSAQPSASPCARC
jgi:hypothetical protein